MDFSQKVLIESFQFFFLVSKYLVFYKEQLTDWLDNFFQPRHSSGSVWMLQNKKSITLTRLLTNLTSLTLQDKESLTLSKPMLNLKPLMRLLTTQKHPITLSQKHLMKLNRKHLIKRNQPNQLHLGDPVRSWKTQDQPSTPSSLVKTTTQMMSILPKEN